MNRIDELAPKAADQSLTPTEAVELESLLASDPETVRIFVSMMDLEAALRGLRSGFDLCGETLERIHSLNAEHTEEAVLTRLATMPPAPWEGQARMLRRWRYAMASLAIAAGVLLAVWLGRAPAPSSGEPTARIIELTGRLDILSPDGKTRTANVGDALELGQTLFTSGEDSSAVVEYTDSTRLEMSSETLVRLTSDSARKVVFSKGVLRACVSGKSAATQMVVVAPQAEIRAFDSCFLLASASPDASRIDLEAGIVEIVRQSDGRSYDVHQGSFTVTTMIPEAPVIQMLPDFRTVPVQKFGQVPMRVVGFLPNQRTVMASYPQVSFRDRNDRELKFTTKTLRSGGMYSASTNGGSSLSLDGSRLAICTSDGVIHVWDTNSQQEIRSVDAGGYPTDVLPVTVTRDWILAAEPLPPNSNKLRAWKLSGGPASVMEIELKSIRSLAASPDRKLFAVGGERKSKAKGDHPIWLYRFDTMERIASLPGMTTATKVIAFSPDGKHIAGCGTDPIIRVWDISTQTLVRTIQGHERQVSALAFSPDGSRLAGGTQTGQVWIWNTETGQEQLVIQAGTRQVWGIAFSPDATRLMTAVHNQPPALWDIAE